MGQRNMVYMGPILETEHGHLHPEPYNGIPTFNPQRLPENHTILPQLPGTRASFTPQHLPETHAPLPHTMSQYDHHHNVYMTPPGARVFPVALNHGIPDQIPFSIRGAFERNEGQFMDGIGIGMNGAFKRKNAEGYHGNMNIQYFYPAAAAGGASSSVAIPMNAEGGMMDGGGGSFPIPEFRGGNRGGGIGVDPVLIPGNYGGQPIQAPWLDQQFCGNGGGDSGGAFSWNHAPGLPYLQGHMNEAANIGLHGYQVAAGNRNSGGFVHGPHNLHHPPPPPMPPMQGHNMDFHSQLAASTSLRLPANTTTAINPFQNGMEPPPPPPPGPRFVGPTPPTGLRVYRPHRRELMLERHRGFPHLRVLPEDGVAILDISGYHEVGHSVDHHRDMRLDIDHMSYEELLALGEQIGSVGSRLSDDFVVEHLKTRVFTSSKSSSDDQELNSCVICQTNYDDEEQIGVLDCGHEYHVECVKKWLVVKNTCPVCKSTALGGEAKETVS